MTLSKLIRKRDTWSRATAIPAIPATQPNGEAATVARIATVAVATTKDEKTAPPAKVAALSDPAAPCPTCNGGSLWRDQAGAWHCERCHPPGAEPVRTWRNFAGGKPTPAPRPAEAWPSDLNGMLRRVATAFEWSDADRRDFVAWARRSKDGMADARAFLVAECDKLPAPGLSDRRRAVLDMLKADPALRVAWTCADDGRDAVTLTLAIRDKGTCELAIPRERFDALALPGLIDRLIDPMRPHAKAEGAA